MLNLACPECDNPIYELKDGSMECANCEKKVFYEKDVDFDKSKIQDDANITLKNKIEKLMSCLLYTSPSPRDGLLSRMPSSA